MLPEENFSFSCVSRSISVRGLLHVHDSAAKNIISKYYGHFLSDSGSVLDTYCDTILS